ncbi:hypothetical protein MPTK1_7g08200 [Marchantia polymorpha subsp. ruderalis]|uniref:Uncharacterized protein n=2 Tax=Marchantia polymorpha TaxID=3197 RepID=A0AAF6BXB7_MARPO|nr:hypothetical protein MARPO_0146s0020 [Marchantia polymorpha]BBN16651.1 hypothetical protein Mp_7g08200 [Marchantia polymorpha subsp. ruderalis]|eukprot:PTQ29198.1 hypothetical protein MARPO_0146s0020 [Marchantia polymorpha]
MDCTPPHNFACADVYKLQISSSQSSDTLSSLPAASRTTWIRLIGPLSASSRFLGPAALALGKWKVCARGAHSMGPSLCPHRPPASSEAGKQWNVPWPDQSTALQEADLASRAVVRTSMDSGQHGHTNAQSAGHFIQMHLCPYNMSAYDDEDKRLAYVHVRFMS